MITPKTRFYIKTNNLCFYIAILYKLNYTHQHFTIVAAISTRFPKTIGLLLDDVNFSDLNSLKKLHNTSGHTPKKLYLRQHK